jgi:hypothetical protein
MMKALLLFRGGPQTIIISTPFYLRDWEPERRRLTGWRLRRARPA